MPEMSGYTACVALKADRALADIPVVFVTAHRDEAFEIAGFEAGASDFIGKPVNPPLVLARVNAQLRFKKMADELRRGALVDALTGLSNRRRFDQVLFLEWARARRARTPISLAMVDVDHFKRYNDRYGHPAGDACLCSVAQALTGACLRPGDLVARYGGEEFALLLPETPFSGARHVAQRVLAALAALDIKHEASPDAAHVTVSIGGTSYGEGPSDWHRFGGATVPPDGGRPTPSALVQGADEALYQAKRAGRGQALVVPLTFDRERPSVESDTLERILLGRR